MLTAYYTLTTLRGRIATDRPDLVYVNLDDKEMASEDALRMQHRAFRKAKIGQGTCVFVSFAYASGRFKKRNIPRLVVYDRFGGVNFVDTTRPYRRTEVVSRTTPRKIAVPVAVAPAPRTEPPPPPVELTSIVSSVPPLPSATASPLTHTKMVPRRRSIMTCPRCRVQHRVDHRKRHLGRCPVLRGTARVGPQKQQVKAREKRSIGLLSPANRSGRDRARGHHARRQQLRSLTLLVPKDLEHLTRPQPKRGSAPPGYPYQQAEYWMAGSLS
jgi:hypothetical protein